MSTEKPTIVCLMGPTACGKTALAVEWVQKQERPYEIISVDSAMVYRGMDIGTAKPDAATLAIAPHRLIDILDPSERYSAGQFRLDALREINDIVKQGHTPLLVGGTMMYFRILQQGIAVLPRADKNIRAMLDSRAKEQGWQVLHQELEKVDQKAAERIHPEDGQRIQRALEVFLLTGRAISDIQKQHTVPLSEYNVINYAIMPEDRSALHTKITERFQLMLDRGLVAEVEQLFNRGDLHADLPSVRSLGYRQVWDYLEGKCTYDEMRDQAITATRQLAKRQMTWLRSCKNLLEIPALR